MNTASPYVLELKGMTKAFPGVLATDDVDLQVRQGDVHALLGENGAGKSTLVKMIYGILKPDAGSLFFNGEEVDISSPARARKLGVAMVFQHFSLFDALTVVENISLGMDHDESLQELSDKIIDISKRYGLPLDPARHVYTLSVGERQRIEIIRCLLQNPRLLVMDEPTSVLTPQEVEKLFVTLKRLSDEGLSILYISHKLNEIKALCRNATILRLGKKIATVRVEDETMQSLAAMMMGKELQEFKHPPEVATGKVRLSIAGLSMPAPDKTAIALNDLNLEVHAGEVVGVSGVAGNGQDELMAVLSGEQRSSQDAWIQIDASNVGKMGPNQRRLAGLASVPEKRLGHAAVPDMDLPENAFLTSFKRLGLVRKGLIDTLTTGVFTRKIIDEFSVKTPAVDVPADSLSGGNLQKFIIGRELLQNPAILIVAQPTWGVDAGAARIIRQKLRELAASGAAVLVISQDLDELLEISDRIGAICGGRLSRFYPTREITTEQVGMLMAGVKLEQES